MERQWKFCKITTSKGEDFDCTVKVIKNVSQPKDVWYNCTWISINKFRKLEGTNFSVHSYLSPIIVTYYEGHTITTE